MEITSDYLEPGALWTFVHASGKETEYIFDRQIRAGGAGLSPFHALRNPVTGKDAQVSEKWLCEGRMGAGGYWRPKASARRVDRAA